MSEAIAGIGDNLPPNDAEILQATLAEKHAKLLDGVGKLIGAAGRIPPEITDDETAGKASDFIKLVTGCVKNLEAERVNEKEPYLTLGRCVDGFFKFHIDALSNAKVLASRPLDAHLKRKAAEEQRRRLEEAAALRKQAEDQAAAARLLEQANQQNDAALVLDQATITEQQAVKAEHTAQAKPAEMSQTRSTSGALASLRTVWVGEVEDFNAIDLEVLRHHLAPGAVQTAVNSYVRAGGRVLKGAKIFEKSETVVR